MTLEASIFFLHVLLKIFIEALLFFLSLTNFLFVIYLLLNFYVVSVTI